MSHLKKGKTLFCNGLNGEIELISGENAGKMFNGEFEVTVAARGLTAVKVKNLEIESSFQDAINAPTEAVKNSFIELILVMQKQCFLHWVI